MVWNVRMLSGFIFFFVTIHLRAGNDNWNDLYNRENGVFLNKKEDVIISVNKEGELMIQSDIYNEVLYLNDNAKMFNEEVIGYSSTFTSIQELSAYSEVPQDKNKTRKYKVNSFITTDARSSGIFYDDQKKITFYYPALKSGSRTVMSYRKVLNEPRLWGSFVFSSHFPVERCSYSVSAPASVKLKYRLYGLEEGQVDFERTEKSGLVTYTWKAEKMDKISSTGQGGGILHTAPHLIIYIQNYEFEGKKINILSDVNDLHSWYRNTLNEISEEKENENLQLIVKDLIQNRSSELEKVEAIYKWVQDNVKYIAIEDGLGGFIPRNSNKVFSRRYGDCKDMSNLIYHMLDIAGIKSHHTWIGTSSIPYSHKEVPTPMADNHMICTYINNGTYYFLDATDQYNTFGVPTIGIQGREALINKGNGFELVHVPVVDYDKNAVFDTVRITVEGNNLLGKGSAVYSGYTRNYIESALLNLDEERKDTYLNVLLGKGNNKFMVKSHDVSSLKDKKSDLKIDYSFTVDDYALTVNDELFLNPHLTRELDNNFIDISTVKNEIHQSYKSLTSHVVEIEIPEGYVVDHLPENTGFKNEKYGFELSYIKKGQTIQVTQRIFLNAMRIVPDEFDEWNNLIKSLYSAYKESIVFKKS